MLCVFNVSTCNESSSCPNADIDNVIMCMLEIQHDKLADRILILTNQNPFHQGNSSFRMRSAVLLLLSAHQRRDALDQL